MNDLFSIQTTTKALVKSDKRLGKLYTCRWEMRQENCSYFRRCIYFKSQTYNVINEIFWPIVCSKIIFVDEFPRASSANQSACLHPIKNVYRDKNVLLLCHRSKVIKIACCSCQILKLFLIPNCVFNNCVINK
jgi:hypothetical protein